MASPHWAVEYQGAISSDVLSLSLFEGSKQNVAKIYTFVGW